VALMSRPRFLLKTRDMSLILPGCLDNIIGLSEVDCECFTDAPVDSGVSLSGLYIDRLEGLDLKLIDAATDCGTGSVWHMMAQAREDAIIQFKADLFSALKTLYRPRFNPFRGPIGEARFRKNLSINTQYAGVSVCPRPMKGGVMHIKRIGVMFSQNGIFDLNIFDYNQYASLETVTLTAVANKINWTTIAGGIDLPMTDDAGDYVRYDFLYESASMPGQPKDAKISCGCGGRKVYWNEINPRFEDSQTAKRWEVFAMVAGATGIDVSTTETRDNLSRGTLYLNGILLDVEFRCSINDVLCEAVSDFENGLIAVNIAATIRYLAGAILADKILASGNINYYTMSDRERLMGKKNSWTSSYWARMNEDIIPQFPIDANDCLVCDRSSGPHKRGILS
jgi:hypothetical protein